MKRPTWSAPALAILLTGGTIPGRGRSTKQIREFLFAAALSPLLIAAMTGCGRESITEIVKIRSEAVEQHGAEEPTRVLNPLSLRQQAQDFALGELCKAAHDVYCAASRIVRDHCSDPAVCLAVADALYDASSPTFGRTLCVNAADSEC